MKHRSIPGARPSRSRRRFGLQAGVLAVTLFCGAASAAADEVDQLVGSPRVLAPAAILNGNPIDGIPSGPMVGGGYHVHSHLRLFVNGTQRWIPAGIGVTRPLVLDPSSDGPSITAAKGFYWLHTHDESGVIHAEAPAPRAFTLGQFFDIWGQPLSQDRVGPAKGEVTAWVDGQRYEGDPRNIAIGPYTRIQLDVGRDVPYQAYDFPPDL